MMHLDYERGVRMSFRLDWDQKVNAAIDWADRYKEDMERLSHNVSANKKEDMGVAEQHEEEERKRKEKEEEEKKKGGQQPGQPGQPGQGGQQKPGGGQRY